MNRFIIATALALLVPTAAMSEQPQPVFVQPKSMIATPPPKQVAVPKTAVVTTTKSVNSNSKITTGKTLIGEDGASLKH